MGENQRILIRLTPENYRKVERIRQRLDLPSMGRTFCRIADEVGESGWAPERVRVADGADRQIAVTADQLPLWYMLMLRDGPYSGVTLANSVVAAFDESRL